MPGKWNTSSPPSRAGVYFNFTAALQQAITAGSVGTAAVVGTADWGPVGLAEELTGLGTYDATYSTSTAGTLREAALGALDGFDGGGAARVLALRIASSAAKAGNVTLKDGAAANALLLTAKYPGARANNFSVTIQTNPVVAENKDLILFESGVELERWENVLEGKNNNFVTAMNETAPSQYVTAALSGATNRVMANIVGAVGGSGGFAEGNSGLTTLLADVTTGLGVLNNQKFNTIALANTTDGATLDAFVAWLRDRNEGGKRTFGVIGGAEAETLTAARQRLTAAATPPATGTGYSDGKNTDGSFTYRTAALNLVNLGGTDLRRLEDNMVFSSAKLAPRYAGHLARVGFTRSMFNVRWTGYQVNNPLTPSNYTLAGQTGVVVFANDNTQRVFLDNGNSSLLATNDKGAGDRPEALKDSRNVAVCHFIENTLTEVASDMYEGSLPNSETGRNDIVGSFLKFLEGVEVAGGLVPGTSTVTLDEKYVQQGDAVFLKYGIQFQGIVKRIFSTVRVKS